MEKSSKISVLADWVRPVFTGGDDEDRPQSSIEETLVPGNMFEQLYFVRDTAGEGNLKSSL